jgi:NADH-quinone oxidoreductase subunit N
VIPDLATAVDQTLKLPHIDYLSILPELILLGGALLVLLVSSLRRRMMTPGAAAGWTVLISGAALIAALVQWHEVSAHGPKVEVAGAVAYDGFSVLVNVLVSSALILTALVAEGWLQRERMAGPELHVLMMVSAMGAMVMGAADDLIVVFLGLEILSISLYVLAAFNTRRAESGEAALKYFVLGGFSSAVFLYGIALVYGATGTTNLPQIANFLAQNVILHNGLLLAGIALLLAGFGFKVAAVPFHLWTPDVYQGSPTPVTGFMAAVAKVGGFAALLRVFVSSFGLLRADWQPAVWVLAALTLLAGALMALVQRDIKRMLAYSSINHAGFVLLGLEAATSRGVSSSLYYLFVYTFMVIGAFAVVGVVGGQGDSRHDIDNYRGLGSKRPWLAASLAVLLMAQAGIPFTTGFLAKLEVISAAVAAHSTVLAVVAMLSAGIAAFFYLRVIILMYVPTQPDDGAVALPETDDLGLPRFAMAGALPGTLDASAHAAGLEGAGVTADSSAGASSDAEAQDADVVPAEVVPGDVTPADVVPVGVAIAIGLCLAVTVVFGIAPGPVVDFAHKATLLF